MLPKPARFEGSTFETDISNIRVTGDAQFIETIAGLLKPILDLENDETRVELNLQRTKNPRYKAVYWQLEIHKGRSVIQNKAVS